MVSRVGAERGLFSIQLPVFLTSVRFLPFFWLGNLQWIWKPFRLGKTGKYCDYKILTDSPLQTVGAFLFPGEAEPSGSCWCLSSEVERRCCCILPKLLTPQGPGLPLVMSLFERNGDMLMFQTQSGSVAVIPHSIWLGAQNKASGKARQRKNMDPFPCPLFICAVKEKSLAAFSHKESSKSLVSKKGFQGLLWGGRVNCDGLGTWRNALKGRQGPEANVLLETRLSRARWLGSLCHRRMFWWIEPAQIRSGGKMLYHYSAF